MKPIHNHNVFLCFADCVANNPKFRKMKPIHNKLQGSVKRKSVANNPKFRKMKPIHNRLWCLGCRLLGCEQS
ncbi:MAG: hypothetical protein LBC75_05250 [Fibromonadaceae bacterium]|nr:hypothetical protein [Fibromonadaceae bacterium]